MGKSKDLPKYGTGVRGFFKFDSTTNEMKPADKKGNLQVNAPTVISDELPEAIESYATAERKKFTSKSAYRRHLKEHGFRETGGEHIKDVARLRPDEEAEEKQRREDIEKAYFDIKYDRVPFTEQEKENHLREERAWKGKYKVKSPY